MKLLIANILGLISALILVYTGAIKEKNKVLKYQVAQVSFSSLCDLILGGIPSVIINILSIHHRCLYNGHQ